MPKSKTKRTKARRRETPVAWGGAQRRRGDRPWNYGLAGAALIAVALGIFWWWQSSQVESALMAHAAEGKHALERVETFPSEGRGHLQAGEPYHYQTRYPTSGPHSPIWTRPGVYQDPQPKTQLVHALEHGNIVVYHDEPGAEAMGTLRRWANLYDDKWSGLVVVPARGLGESVVLTAWTKRLELEAFDARAAAAFIDAYRGRGPEHSVR